MAGIKHATNMLPQRNKLSFDDVEKSFSEMQGREQLGALALHPPSSGDPSVLSDTLGEASTTTIPPRSAEHPPSKSSTVVNVMPPMQHLQGVNTPTHVWSLGALASRHSSGALAEVNIAEASPIIPVSPDFSSLKELGAKVHLYVANSFLKEHADESPALTALLSSTTPEHLVGIGRYAAYVNRLLSTCLGQQVADRQSQTEPLRKCWDLPVCYMDERVSREYDNFLSFLLPSRAPATELQAIERALAATVSSPRKSSATPESTSTSTSTPQQDAHSSDLVDN
eukprot:gene22526-29649_t